MLLETRKYKGYTIKIHSDDNPASPRDWDNLGTMVCWHRCYILGDEQPRGSPGEWLLYMLEDLGLESFGRDGFITEQWEDFAYDLENDDPKATEKAWAILDKVLIVMPLYLYDHSGLAMSTKTEPFWWHSTWDSMQVGWIYVTKETLRKEYSRQRVTKKLIDDCTKES